MDLSKNMDFIKLIMKSITAQFGDRCEVVYHDLTKDYDKTIAAIENGHITGRSIGDCGTNMGLEILKGTEKKSDIYTYLSKTKNGKTLRSTSLYLKDDTGKVIGSLCINFDITDLQLLSSSLSSFLNPTDHDKSMKEDFSNDINDILDNLITESIEYIGKPTSHMSKEDKIRAIKYLNDRGAFLVKKAGDKVCNQFNVSKYTLYHYLDEGKIDWFFKEENDYVKNFKSWNYIDERWYACLIYW